MYPLKLSTAITIPFFAHDVNGDGVTGIADGSWTKRISKGGGAFAAMTVTITELENGWYSLPVGTGHSDTLEILTMSFSAAACKRVNLQFRVHARTQDDLTFPTVSGRSLDVTATGAAGVDWANVENPTTALNLSATNIATNQVVASVSGAVGSVTAGVTVTTNNDKTGYALSAAGVQAIWDALTAALTTVGSIGKRLADNIDATISSRSTVTTAQVNAEVVDALSVDTYAEPGAVPPATATLAAKLGWLFALARNKVTMTSTTQTLRNDADNANVATSTQSDDGVTYTRAEWL